MFFEETDLNDNILDALYDMRFDECTPIQEKCIPEILNGHDIMGVAQTGTGKTAAYLLPILSMLDDGECPSDAVNCLIMSPTRELAQQIDQAMQGFGYYLNGVSSVAVYGGNDGNRYDQELKALRQGADVVIATPGRFISHIQMGNVDLSRLSFFVLDEADRMLDMGFSEDILSIAKLLPPTCQTIMFSATMPDKIDQLAKSLLKNPVEIKIAVSKPAEKIRQRAFLCHNPQKLGIIKDMFKNNTLKRVIIFSGKKDMVKDIARALKRMKIQAGEMHADLSQAERNEMMYRFKSGQIDVLVATDILARGIDIDDITTVINYDVPHDVEDYVHRIGRTARADRDGEAYTFVNEDDMYYFKMIEDFLEREIEKLPLPEGLGEAPEYKPVKPGRGQKGGGRKRGHGRKKKGGDKDNSRNNKGKKHGGQKSPEPGSPAAKTMNKNKGQKRSGKNDSAKASKPANAPKPKNNQPKPNTRRPHTPHNTDKK